MAHKSRVIVVCMALVLGACTKQQPADKETPAPTPPSGPAAAVQPNTYQGVGVVKALNPRAPAIEIDHEEIVGLMPAMQMEFPVTDGALLSGLAVNDRIDFTVVEKTGVIRVTAIKKK
ncbi:MAG TPA: copper-binding protein [Pyrinomonadaceae bacterium]|nr:copper-binding protein [Pyrinomonadaceae bacterium]